MTSTTILPGQQSPQEQKAFHSSHVSYVLPLGIPPAEYNAALAKKDTKDDENTKKKQHMKKTKVGHNNLSIKITEPKLKAVYDPPSPLTDCDWHKHSSFYFENELFKKGILALTDNIKLCKERRLATRGYFYAKKRKFVVGSLTKNSEENTVEVTIRDNISEKKDNHIKYYKQVKKTHELLAFITHNKGISHLNSTNFIINALRTEEVFLPVAIGQNSDSEDIGMYLYPWISSDNKENRNLLSKSQGISQFVTAICMLGPSLRGLDSKNGSNMPLIKHDLELYPGQQIETIEVDEVDNSFYDQMMFSQCENIALTIKKLANTDNPTLYVHLPYWDYILFAVHIYMHGQMTLQALNDLIKEIYQRKEIFIENINHVCRKNNINVFIHSPFESLFSKVDVETLIYESQQKLFSSKKKSNASEEPLIAIKVLEALNVSTCEGDFSKFKYLPQELDAQNLRDRKLKDELTQIVTSTIECWLEKLQDPKLNADWYHIWADLVSMQKAKFKKAYDEELKKRKEQLASTIEKQQIDNIEALLHVANAFMPAFAAHAKQPYETCSLLPISEKQIQATYAELTDNFNKRSSTNIACTSFDSTSSKSKYAPLVNLLTMEPGFAYKAHNTAGLPFYFNTNNAHGLANLIIYKQLLTQVHQNVYRQVVTTSAPVPLDNVLPSVQPTKTVSPPNSPKKSTSQSQSRVTLFSEKNNIGSKAPSDIETHTKLCSDEETILIKGTGDHITLTY